MSTVLIVPSGAHGPSGQCRIYAHPHNVPNALRAYREDAGRGWREVGLMDSAGNVRCIEPEFAALRDDAPLMAGSQYKF